MTDARLQPADMQLWCLAGCTALAAHLAAGAAALSWTRAPAPLQPDPVVLADLPPVALAERAPAAQAAPPALAAPLPPPVPPLPIDAPPVRASLPETAVAVPAPSPEPQATHQQDIAPAVAMAAPTAPASDSSPAAGKASDDPVAQRQAADYFALLSAHLNRRKTYPPEARKARQQGVVTVRFTIDRSGQVHDATIKRSSGHDILDQATLDLLLRVSPLPRMPASMTRERITVSLPIDYALRTY